MLSAQASSALRLAVGVLAVTATAQKDPIRPYPLAHARGSGCVKPILNHTSYLTGFHDPQWYLDNIPFVDFPDQLLRDVYYYRQSVNKRHLKYTKQGHGWVFTEFIQGVDHAAKFQSIADSAPYHIAEARWLRDPSYAKDLIQLYTRGGVEALKEVTFTHHILNAVLEHAQVTGDTDFLTAQLDGMIAMYRLWDSKLDNTTGLYFRKPVNDAQEYALAGYVVGGPNGTEMTDHFDWNNDFSMHNRGPETYRPNFNAYMVANSRAIAQVAKLSNKTDLAAEWQNVSATLESNMHKLLWNEDVNFWIDVIQKDNLEVMGRQLIGYFPYRFGIGIGAKFERALEFGLNHDHFLAEYGPTTVEKTDKFYTARKNSTTNTVWNGQSWPFSTCVYLHTLAIMARNNVSELVTPEFFYEQLSTYTKTNTKNGVPYTSEAHYPDVDRWSADHRNHSEHYFHSTYGDNIFTNLLGIIPTLEDRLELRPLIPKNWTRFVVENLPYHGAMLSFLWDESGTAYPNRNHSAGFSIYIDGRLAHHQATLVPVNITMPNQAAAITTLSTAPRYANILGNPDAPHGYPSITADHYWVPSSSHSTSHMPWRLNDGLLFYDLDADNRWVALENSRFWATIWVELPRPRTFSSLSLAVQSAPDTDDIDCPLAIHIINNRTNELLASRQPWTDCVGNALNTISFGEPVPLGTNGNATTNATGVEVTTDALRIVLISKLTLGTALSEMQIWVPTPLGPRYEAEDGLTGTYYGSLYTAPLGMNSIIAKLAEGYLLGGGVTLFDGAWVELADVRAGPKAEGGKRKLTVVGAGNGTVEVQMNFLKNSTAVFDGSAAAVNGSVVDHNDRQNVTVEVDFLPGGNVVTLFRTDGAPFVDAIVVE